jgi:DNA-binding LacI/PurR family transcriptional regulator
MMSLRARKPPSAHDVARRAGVSQAAVSRAFTEGASISQATRAKVVRAASVLGYRPNLLARSLIKGHSGIIGVVMGDPRNPFYLAAFEALSERLAAAGRHILIFTGEGNAAGDVPVQDLLKYRVDALLLMSTSLSSPLARQCHAEGISVVFFNRRASSAPDAGSVTGANRAGAQMIATHLLTQGYRRLAFMAGSADSSTSRERETGFTDQLAAAGLGRPMRAAGHFQRAGAIAATRELLSLPAPPDAIFCANDHMALAAMEIARFEFGLAAGRGLGIVGFDDIEQASWPSFGLTSYSQPIAGMVDAVTGLLLGGTNAHAVIPGNLIVRGSTRRV